METENLKLRDGGARLSHRLRASLPLISGEDPEELEELSRGVMESLKPVGRLEEELAARAVSCMWRLRRINNLEAEMFEELARQADQANIREAMIYLDDEGFGRHGRSWTTNPEKEDVAEAFRGIRALELQNRMDGVGLSVARGLSTDGADKTLNLIRRYETALDRCLSTALMQLDRVQSARKRAEEADRQHALCGVGVPIPQSPNHRITQSPPTPQSPNHPTTQSPPAPQAAMSRIPIPSPNPPIAKLPSYPVAAPCPLNTGIQSVNPPQSPYELNTGVKSINPPR